MLIIETKPVIITYFFNLYTLYRLLWGVSREFSYENRILFYLIKWYCYWLYIIILLHNKWKYGIHTIIFIKIIYLKKTNNEILTQYYNDWWGGVSSYF